MLCSGSTGWLLAQGSRSTEVFRRPPVTRGLQSRGPPRELPPGRTVPADPGCSLPAHVNPPVNESSVPGGGREGGGDPKLRTAAGGESAVGDYRDAGSESWVPKATASNQDPKQRRGDCCGFKNPILAPTPGTMHAPSPSPKAVPSTAHPSAMSWAPQCRAPCPGEAAGLCWGRCRPCNSNKIHVNKRCLVQPNEIQAGLVPGEPPPPPARPSGGSPKGAAWGGRCSWHRAL